MLSQRRRHISVHSYHNRLPKITHNISCLNFVYQQTCISHTCEANKYFQLFLYSRKLLLLILLPLNFTLVTANFANPLRSKNHVWQLWVCCIHQEGCKNYQKKVSEPLNILLSLDTRITYRALTRFESVQSWKFAQIVRWWKIVTIKTQIFKEILIKFFNWKKTQKKGFTMSVIR